MDGQILRRRARAICHPIHRIIMSDQRPTPFGPQRWLRFCLYLVAAASAITCIVMPALGVKNFFHEFRVPYSVAVHARILAEQCVGPVYTLMVVLPCAALSLIGKKRIPWWSLLLGVAGPIYTVFTSRTISHDLSHALFQECSGIYGEWIQGICVAGGLALAGLVGLELNARLTQRAGAAPEGEVL